MSVRTIPMIPSDQIQADTKPDDAETRFESESAVPLVETVNNEAESIDDEAWLNACRQELNNDDDPVGTPADTENTFDRSHQEPDGDENSASPEGFDPGAALTKTGDDVMSKFGHAIGALAECDEDFDDQALDYAADLRKSDILDYLRSSINSRAA